MKLPVKMTKDAFELFKKDTEETKAVLETVGTPTPALSEQQQVQQALKKTYGRWMKL